MSRLHDVAVVGGGSAGTMAYLRAVLNYDDTVWFTGDSKTRKRGRGTWVSAVDNIPGFHGDIRPIASAATSTQKWIEAHPHLSQKSTVVRSMVTSISLSDEGAFELVSEAK